MAYEFCHVILDPQEEGDLHNFNVLSEDDVKDFHPLSSPLGCSTGSLFLKIGATTTSPRMTEVMMPVGQRARSGASSALNEGVREFYGVPSSLFHSVQGQNKSVRSVAVAWRE